MDKRKFREENIAGKTGPDSLQHDGEFSVHDALDDPLIAQVRKADGVTTENFAKLLIACSDAYRASAILRLHQRRADLFYRTIGAGSLENDRTTVTPWVFRGRVGHW